MGSTALLPLRSKAYCGFLSPSAGFELANLGSCSKHANYYITKDYIEGIVFSHFYFSVEVKNMMKKCSSTVLKK
jgi:hypothetical protein